MLVTACGRVTEVPEPPAGPEPSYAVQPLINASETFGSAIHLRRQSPSHHTAGHVGDDGGRKLCPPSTLTGRPRTGKPSGLRRWIAELGSAEAIALLYDEMT